MDSIEKAMLSRSRIPNAPLVVAPKIEEDAIERAIGRAAVTPVAAPVAPKRTQRSVTLDMEWISAAGMLVPDTRRSRIKEEYRHIKRPLLMNIDGKGASTVEHANLIMVTSARPGRGQDLHGVQSGLEHRRRAESNRAVSGC
jgi:protein-tyrosine kinase